MVIKYLMCKRKQREFIFAHKTTLMNYTRWTGKSEQNDLETNTKFKTIPVFKLFHTEIQTLDY